MISIQEAKENLTNLWVQERIIECRIMETRAAINLRDEHDEEDTNCFDDMLRGLLREKETNYEARKLALHDLDEAYRAEGIEYTKGGKGKYNMYTLREIERDAARRHAKIN